MMIIRVTFPCLLMALCITTSCRTVPPPTELGNFTIGGYNMDASISEHSGEIRIYLTCHNPPPLHKALPEFHIGGFSHEAYAGGTRLTPLSRRNQNSITFYRDFNQPQHQWNEKAYAWFGYKNGTTASSEIRVHFKYDGEEAILVYADANE